MITPVGLPAISHLLMSPREASANEASASEAPSSNSPATHSPSSDSAPEGTSLLYQGDTLSLSSRETRTQSDAFYERASLKTGNRSHLRVTDDGQVAVSSRSKLRFNYDFEAADGTEIHIRAKVNVDYVRISDQDSQSVKFRANAGVSVVQTDVSTGVAPLLDAPEISPDAKDSISQAVDRFQQVTDAVASVSLNSDPLDGDGLITGLVEAFNGLSETLRSLFFSPPADANDESAGELGELPEPESSEAASPADVAVEPQPGIAPNETSSTSQHDEELTDNVGQEEISALELEGSHEADAPEGAGEDQEIEIATPAESQPSVDSVMFGLRSQVIKSLTSLVGVFHSDSSTLQISHSIFKGSAHLAAYQASEPGADGLLSSDESRVDTHV